MAGEAFRRDDGEEYDEQVVMGYPVDLAALPEVDQRVYAALAAQGRHMTFYPGSVTMPCAGCGVLIFVGPRSNELLKANPKARPKCPMCIARLVAENDASVDLTDLGNREGYPRTY